MRRSIFQVPLFIYKIHSLRGWGGGGVKRLFGVNDGAFQVTHLPNLLWKTFCIGPSIYTHAKMNAYQMQLFIDVFYIFKIFFDIDGIE